MLNDVLQSIVPAIYPLLKDSLLLNFTQVGIITLVFQLSSSLFQPVIGYVTDRKPQPYSLPVGMFFTMVGILSLAFANSFVWVIVSVFLTGVGSSIFHPEASRLAHLASGGKTGLAQSLFQVGGNFGGSLGPLLAALFIAPYGRQNIGWLAIVSVVCMGIMLVICRWYKSNISLLGVGEDDLEGLDKTVVGGEKRQLLSKRVVFVLSILLLLIFSKYVYMSSLTSYYTFYLIDKFGVSVRNSQFFLFAFLFAVAAGTLLGGPIGDRVGRKYVIWVSILGTAPFALMMPHVNLLWTCVLSIVIGFVLSSAFSAILVYAQELLPGRVGLIGGLFFGLAFGIAGIASSVWGIVADSKGIEYVYNICSYLPLLGLVAGFLPRDPKKAS